MWRVSGLGKFYGPETAQPNLFNGQTHVEVYIKIRAPASSMERSITAATHCRRLVILPQNPCVNSLMALG
jgi:hypothetical protein